MDKLMNDKKWDGVDRRHIPKQKDIFYRLVMAGNILVWFLFVGALTLYHYARPEQISGVQRFWGVTGREEWNTSLTIWLLSLLAVCALVSTVLVIMRRQRNRRKNESWFSNLTFLALVCIGFAVFVLKSIGS